MYGSDNSTVESRFLEPLHETEIGSRNREFEKSEGKLEGIKSKGNDNWFELSGLKKTVCF